MNPTRKSLSRFTVPLLPEPHLLGKLDDAQRDAASAYGRAKPKQFDWIEAGREAQRARDVEAKLQVNGKAATRGVGAVPAVRHPAARGGGSAQRCAVTGSAAETQAATGRVKTQCQGRCGQIQVTTVTVATLTGFGEQWNSEPT